MCSAGKFERPIFNLPVESDDGSRDIPTVTVEGHWISEATPPSGCAFSNPWSSDSHMATVEDDVRGPTLECTASGAPRATDCPSGYKLLSSKKAIENGDTATC